MPELDSQTPPAGFNTTRWSLVLAAGRDSSPQCREALEQLCRTYWKPLYSYARMKGRSDADAEDATQDFFARFLARDYLRLADRDRGRFRSFLLTSLKHFLVNDWRHQQAACRGGGAEAIPLHEDGAEERIAADAANPDAELLFDQQWAAALIEQTLSDLRAEYVAAGKGDLFERLKPFVGGGTTPVPEYETVAGEIGMAVGAVRVAVHRLRERYRELLRSAVAHTVASPADVDDELRHLIQVIRAA